MFTSDTNRAQRILRLLSAAENRGLERHSLLSRIGLTSQEVTDPEARVPISKTIQLWQILDAEIGDPDLGLEVGGTVHIREAGVVGYAMRHSETLQGAIHRLVRFARLLRKDLQLTLRREGPRWHLHPTNPPPLTAFRPPVDEALAGLVTVFSEITGRALSPAEVHLSYPKPLDIGEHRRLFGSGLQFDRPLPGLVLWNRDMQWALQAADPQLAGYLDELADLRLAELPAGDTVADRVREVVWPRLSAGAPPLGEVATEMAVSRRTLQRRLREEGTSFADVIESLRRDQARLLLEDPRLAIYEIGYLLGYSDPSAFYRAFRRWFGRSPSHFRAQRLS